MFRTRQRNLTLEQVWKMSARFKLPADVFIHEASAPQTKGGQAALTFDQTLPASLLSLEQLQNWRGQSRSWLECNC